MAIQIDPEVTPRDDGDREPLSVAPSREGVVRLYAVQRERALRAGAGESALSVARGADDGTVPVSGGKHCGAGSSGIAVDPYGNVYPCVQWRRPVGNLHQQSIREIWTGSSGLREVRELTAEAKKVVDGFGPSGTLLNFCPGSAVTRTGDPLRVYPEAVLRMEAVEEALGGLGPEAARKKTRLPVVP